MILFGDPGVLDPYGDTAAEILFRKCELGYRFLADSWPEDAIPAKWQEVRDVLAANAREAIMSIRNRHPEIPNTPIEYPSRIVVAVKQDADTQGWFAHDKVFTGAYVQAVEYAVAAAHKDAEPQVAMERLEYAAKIIDETNDYDRRGCMRSGTGKWAELPQSPWPTRLEQFPMQVFDSNILF